MKKADYWDPTFEDMLTLIARLPRLAALIYRHVFRNGDITQLVGGGGGGGGGGGPPPPPPPLSPARSGAAHALGIDRAPRLLTPAGPAHPGSRGRPARAARALRTRSAQCPRGEDGVGRLKGACVPAGELVRHVRELRAHAR